MSGFLFDKIVFGPLQSRRLGTSLGVNLLPRSYKLCTFNCIYCECGWTYPEKQVITEFHSAENVRDALEAKLSSIQKNKEHLDVITFAGNGEPTLHPEFSKIIDFTIALRDKYYPSAKVSVLSNSSTLGNPEIAKALSKVDSAILKLDAGSERTYKLINKPLTDLSLKEITSILKKFPNNLIIQTIFLKGEIDGEKINNTTDSEVGEWLKLLEEIKPVKVMIYPIDRETPAKNISKISREKLNEIGEKVKKLNIDVLIVG
ncbi:MAG: radical SAM protein [Bacteroidota bacterium]|nr:radical SAM protein [Bacteroidota bacterium]